MDQGSNKNHSPAYNFTPTVTKFCVMWEGLSLPHDTKFDNCRCKIVDSRSFHSWSLIHGLRWSGLIKVGPDHNRPLDYIKQIMKTVGWILHILHTDYNPFLYTKLMVNLLFEVLRCVENILLIMKRYYLEQPSRFGQISHFFYLLRNTQTHL